MIQKPRNDPVGKAVAWLICVKQKAG